jgi:hypothetical protein
VTNTGTITITAPTTIAGAVTVANNAGELNLNAPTSITGNVTVTNNSGKLNYATPLIASTGINSIVTNTGEINFTQNLTTGIANFLKVPSNKGVISFKGSLRAEALGSATTATDSITGPGKVVFGGPATFNAGTIIGCDTEFNEGVNKRTAGALILNGNVTLGYEQTINLSVGGNLILGAGKTIYVGTNPVLTAGSAQVTLTSATGAVLTAGSEQVSDTDPNPDVFVGNKTLTLGADLPANATTAAITVTSGELKVPGALIVGTETGVIVTGTLTLEEGGILGFPEDADDFKVTLGDTVITGDAATAATAISRLTASGGVVSLTENKISGRGSTLAVAPDLGSPTITVDKAAGGANLTLAGVNLDLVGGGSLVIKGNTTAANRVTLELGPNPGKLTLGDNKEFTITGSFLVNKHLASGAAFKAVLTGGGVLLGDADREAFGPTAGPTIGELSAVEFASLFITGAAAATDATITAGIIATN